MGEDDPTNPGISRARRASAIVAARLDIAVEAFARTLHLPALPPEARREFEEWIRIFCQDVLDVEQATIDDLRRQLEQAELRIASQERVIERLREVLKKYDARRV